MMRFEIRMQSQHQQANTYEHLNCDEMFLTSFSIFHFLNMRHFNQYTTDALSGRKGMKEKQQQEFL